MRFLPSSQWKFNFHLVSLFKKLECLSESNFSIAHTDTYRKANAFDVDFGGLSLTLLRLLFFLVFELTVVKNFTHRRLSLWGNFNKIHFFGLSKFDGFLGRNHTHVLPFSIKKTNFRDFDLLVHLILGNVQRRFSDSMAMDTHR